MMHEIGDEVRSFDGINEICWRGHLLYRYRNSFFSEGIDGVGPPCLPGFVGYEFRYYMNYWDIKTRVSM